MTWSNFNKICIFLVIIFEGLTVLTAAAASASMESDVEEPWKASEPSLEFQNDERSASFSIHFPPGESGAGNEHSGIPYLISASNINAPPPPPPFSKSQLKFSRGRRKAPPPPPPNPIWGPKWKSKLKFPPSATDEAVVEKNQQNGSRVSKPPHYSNQIPRKRRNKRFSDDENNSFSIPPWDLLSPSRRGALICEICVLMDSEFERNYGDGSSTMTMLEEIVDKVSWIFRNVDWDEDGMPDNMGFKIKTVQRNWNFLPGETPGNYSLRKDGRALLALFGIADYSHCCLALGLTMRPFLRNEVAVSIRGERRNLGGICEYRRDDPGTRLTTSLNLILLSGSGPGDLVLDPTQLEMTLLHELGHSFGSTHDYNLSHSTVNREIKGKEDDMMKRLRECSGHDPRMVPVGDRRVLAFTQWEPIHGRFIMWPSSPQGKRTLRKNNFAFSPCSKRRVMEILTSSREFCFVEDLTPFCGNGILEATEECDCGIEVECLEIGCCGHRQSPRPCQLLNVSNPCPVETQRLAGNSSLNFTSNLGSLYNVERHEQTEESTAGVFKFQPNYHGLVFMLARLLWQ